jgi:hypothetical protein
MIVHTRDAANRSTPTAVPTPIPIFAPFVRPMFWDKLPELVVVPEAAVCVVEVCEFVVTAEVEDEDELWPVELAERVLDGTITPAASKMDHSGAAFHVSFVGLPQVGRPSTSEPQHDHIPVVALYTTSDNPWFT